MIVSKTKKTWIAVLALSLLASACGSNDGAETGTEAESAASDDGASDGGDADVAAGDDCQIFMMLPNSTTIRFERRDAPLTQAALAELRPECEVVVQNGEGDPDRQQRQVEDAVSQGASAILLTSADANLAAGSLQAAADGGVPVILYEHDAIGGPAAAHVLFDALSVGRAQGERAAEWIDALLEEQDVIRIGRVKGNQGEFGTTQYEIGQNEFLDPYIDAGQVEIVCEQFTPNWDPVEAQSFAEDCLTQTGGDIDMFLGMNDGTTGGAVAALISQGYAPGDVVVTGGQDATVEALQFIVQGWQDNTIFKDLRVMAQAAAEITDAVLDGADLPADLINGGVDNEFAEIPAAFLGVENVTADNLRLVVDAGVYTWDELCQGAEDTDICQANL